MFTRIASTLFCAALLLALLPIPAQADTVERLRAFFAATTSMRAEFQQVVHDNQGRKVQEVTGSMQLQRPGKFRWDYRAPYMQIIIGDGKDIWLYDPDLAQVTVRTLDRVLGTSPAALLAGSQDVDRVFTLSDAGRESGLEWVKAVPRDQESGFDQVLLGFDGNTLMAMRIHDSFGQVTDIAFSAVERNPRLAPSTFMFTLPAGVDVLRE